MHVYYEDIYRILVFLFAIYIAGLVTKSLGMPALVGEIITGFLVSSLYLNSKYFELNQITFIH